MGEEETVGENDPIEETMHGNRLEKSVIKDALKKVQADEKVTDKTLISHPTEQINRDDVK